MNYAQSTSFKLLMNYSFTTSNSYQTATEGGAVRSRDIILDGQSSYPVKQDWEFGHTSAYNGLYSWGYTTVYVCHGCVNLTIGNWYSVPIHALYVCAVYMYVYMYIVCTVCDVHVCVCCVHVCVCVCEVIYAYHFHLGVSRERWVVGRTEAPALHRGQTVSTHFHFVNVSPELAQYSSCCNNLQECCRDGEDIYWVTLQQILLFSFFWRKTTHNYSVWGWAGNVCWCSANYMSSYCVCGWVGDVLPDWATKTAQWPQDLNRSLHGGGLFIYTHVACT